MQVFSNVAEDGRATGVHPEKGTLVWHTDKSYIATPSLTTVLRSPAIARRGGDTLFADMARALGRPAGGDESPDRRAARRPRLGRVPPQVGRAPGDGGGDGRRRRPVEHPVVRTHPETGRKALYIGNHASHIAGWPAAEGAALLAELEAHATRPEYIHRHEWQVDDVLMWDNRCTMHCVEPYDAAVEKRAVHRVVVRGDRPF